MLSTESFPTADLGVITCHGSARNILLLSDWCALLVSTLRNGTRNFVLRKESLKDRLALRCLPTKHQCSKGSTFCNPKPAKHAWQQKIENAMFSKFPETSSKNDFLARRRNLSSTWLLTNLDRKTDTITIPLSPPSVCRKNRVAAWSVFVAAQHEESVAGFMVFQFSNSSNRLFKYVQNMFDRCSSSLELDASACPSTAALKSSDLTAWQGKTTTRSMTPAFLYMLYIARHCYTGQLRCSVLVPRRLIRSVPDLICISNMFKPLKCTASAPKPSLNSRLLGDRPPTTPSMKGP